LKFGHFFKKTEGLLLIGVLYTTVFVAAAWPDELEKFTMYRE
jgi:hypothetical protein